MERLRQERRRQAPRPMVRITTRGHVGIIRIHPADDARARFVAFVELFATATNLVLDALSRALQSLLRNRTARALVAFTQPQEERMDMREASALTEASGLTDEQDGRETSGSDTPIEMHLSRPLSRISDVLRKITLAAPLSSLFIAFLAGVMLARRR